MSHSYGKDIDGSCHTNQQYPMNLCIPVNEVTNRGKKSALSVPALCPLW